jgi:hypothetical protein
MWNTIESEDYKKLDNQFKRNGGYWMVYDTKKEWSLKQITYYNFNLVRNSFRSGLAEVKLEVIRSESLKFKSGIGEIDKIVQKDTEKHFIINVFFKPGYAYAKEIPHYQNPNWENVPSIVIQIEKHSNERFSSPTYKPYHPSGLEKSENDLFNEFNRYWRYNSLGIEFILTLLHSRDSFFISKSVNYTLPSLKVKDNYNPGGGTKSYTRSAKTYKIKQAYNYLEYSSLNEKRHPWIVNVMPLHLDICLESMRSYEKHTSTAPHKDTKFYTDTVIPCKKIISQNENKNFSYIFKLIIHVLVIEKWEHKINYVDGDMSIHIIGGRYSEYKSSEGLPNETTPSKLFMEQLLVLCIKYHNLLEEFLMLNSINNSNKGGDESQTIDRI